MDQTPRTRFFANCLGVFEGGGVRTAAFSGAYDAAFKAGVGFSDVVGTSGGSIAAALVATGAHPDRIWGVIQKLEFSALLRPPRANLKFANRPHFLKRAAAFVFSSEYRSISSFVTHGGLHDSSAIKDWVESALRELLGLVPGEEPVRFEDLPIPLYVVASDLVSREPKVWSRAGTPTESVSLAVECSCAIPFFFQPVHSGGTIYADGGVLSKMPSFVFAQDGGDLRDPGSRRVLTLRLKQSGNAPSSLNAPQSLAKAIVDTVVDGASKIQGKLQPNQFFVDIDTGDVGSTNFDIDKNKKEFLFNQGSVAMASFVRNEREALAKIPASSRFIGRDEKYLFYVQSLRNCNSDITVADGTSEWLYSVFPALADACRRKISITCVVTENKSVDEARRIRLLEALGALVIVVQQTPFRGLICDADSPNASVAVTSGSGHDNEDTRVYAASADRAVVRLLVKAMRDSIGKFSPKSAPDFTDEECDKTELFNYLRAVPQYQNSDFALETVKLDERLHGVQTFLKEFKYLQIDWMSTSSRDSMFKPHWLRLSGGISTLVLPPIVEKSGDKYIVIEGHVRAMQCLRRGMTEFDAVVIDCVPEPLPLKPLEFGKISVQSKTVPKSRQFPEYVDSRWRYIERDVRNKYWRILEENGPAA
jgi:predicted acylesterase/phospholipase RssA